MRLLSRVDGQLKFTDRRDEKYAILSHTWGDQEVKYEDVLKGCSNTKIDFALRQAADDGYQHVWVDTCCIDKRNLSELHEAINLMWHWYKNAEVCYAYIVDEFPQSRWFTRGWTLQELIAPKELRFYNANGLIGSRESLRQDILQVCGVPVEESLENISIERRYKWSLGRKTHKIEDASYCMVGLLEVRLIFNYGEGEYARVRLIEAVEKEHGQRTARAIRALHEPVEQHTSTTMTLDELLDSLRFELMDTRRQIISSPYPDTCRWLLEHEAYQQWTSKSSRILWLKGGPGTGKSVLMKSIQERSNGISFFFNARGEPLERTTIGMYRSLFFQLVHRRPEILEYVNSQSKIGRWAVNVPCIQAAIKHLTAQMDPVECFVDALDECHQDDVQEMVDFFEDSSLRICFASRHYPAIVIRGIEIHLERQDKRHLDLERFVYGRLVAVELREEVVRKARGIFLWAVVVVKRLNIDCVNGDVHMLRERLDSLPSELAALFRQITRTGQDSERFHLCLNWVLYAERPLLVNEFYHAMISDQYKITPEEELPEKAWLTKFVLSCSRGLAEVADGEVGRVQFIHESVRDYLLNEGLEQISSQTLFEAQFAAHERLKLICLHYLQHLETTGVTFHTRDSYPLYRYANAFILHHAEYASYGVSQVQFLSQVHDSYGWVMMGGLGHTLMLHKAPNLIRTAHRHGMKISESDFSLVKAAYDYSTHRVLNALLECGVDVDGRGFGGRTALTTAAEKGDIYWVKRMLSCGANVNSRSETLDTPLMYFAKSKAHDNQVALRLIEYKADLEVKDRGGRTALAIAVTHRKHDLIRLLIEHGADIESRNIWGRTALFAASLETSKLLLQLGADIDATDSEGRTALHKAAFSDSPTVKLLLEWGAQMDGQDMRGMTPLALAAAFERSSSYAYLLACGAATDLVDYYGRTAPDIAATRGIETVEVVHEELHELLRRRNRAL